MKIYPLVKDTIEVGSLLENGALVLKYHQTQMATSEHRAAWVVLCYWSGFKPFVVWNVYYSDGKFMAERGDYHKTVEESLTTYSERGGH